MTKGKLYKRIRPLVLLLCLPFLATGCWDRLEVNDVAIVVAMGIDREKDGTYKLSLQIPLPGQMGSSGSKGGGGGTGGSKSYYIDSESGTTTRQAAVTLQKRMSRRLIYGHYRVLIISEEVARNGIENLFDIFSRWPENRLTSYVIVSKGKAIDLLEVQSSLERFSGEAMRELIQMGGFIPVSIKTVGQTLSHIGTDPIIAYMGQQETGAKEKSKEIQVLGYAQFQGDKMVDVFENEAAAGLAWMKREAKPVFLNVALNQPKRLQFNVSRAKTTITPSVDGNNRVKFKIEVEARLAVVENMTMEDLSEEQTIRKEIGAASASIKNQIEKAVATIRKNGSDSADLGMIVYRKYPRKWQRTLKQHWTETLKNAEFDIHVDADIVQSGLANENIVRQENR
ncbi:Ger(x)C family spore germination protein [Cohnella soli]|uniref:Ger(X)C family spore germination protein n=1 Tax=Cohnella soli TaxID=425005 RepID=A0ABW0HUQ4_9BACL